MNQILLPDPTSPLSDKVDSAAIKWPKAEVAAVLVSASAISIPRFLYLSACKYLKKEKC